jgi:hypothetical protein
MKLLTLKFGYFGSALTLPTCRYHKNRGVYDVVGELFAIDHWDLSQVGHIWWHHSGDLYGFGHVLCDTPVTLVGVSSCRHLSMVVLSADCCDSICQWWSFLLIVVIINIWYHLMGGTVNKWMIVWGVMMVPWEIMLCSWVFWFAEPQHHDGLDDLPFLLSDSIFHHFKLCCGWILFKSVF